MTRGLCSSLVACSLFVGATTPVAADRLMLVAVEPSVADDRPRVLVRVRTEPHPHRPDDFELVVSTRGSDEAVVRATAMREVGTARGQSTAIVFVVEATEPFLGACASGVQSAEALAQVRSILVAARSWRVGRLGLVMLSDRAPEVMPLVSADERQPVLSADGHCGRREPTERNGAVHEATRMLREASVDRPIVVFIGRSGTQVDAGLLGGVEVYSLVVRVKATRHVGFAGETLFAETAGRLGDEARRLVSYLHAFHEVEFDGAALPFDGRDHRVALRIAGGEEIDAGAPVWLPRRTPPRDRKLGAVLLGGAIAIGALIAVGLVTLLARRMRRVRQARGREREIVETITPDSPRKTLVLAPVRTQLLHPYHGPCGVAGWLVSLTGSRPFQTYVLDRSGDTLIGTKAGCGIILGDDKVSKEHCKVLGRDGHFHIIDQGSLNGVYVDGAKILGQKTLRSGMRIKLGDTELVFKSVHPERGGG